MIRRPDARRAAPALRLILALAAGPFVPLLRAQVEPELPSWELNSPEDRLPASVEPGLSNRRAIPTLPTPDAPAGYVPLFRLTRPYYDTLFATLPPQYLPSPDPASFRPVIANEAPVGLQPRRYRDGLIEFYPSFGLAQSFDSNVNLTPTNEVADFYITPRAGLELQIGTPDSAWIEGYDTIIGLHSSYEAYGDLFFENPELSAFNQKFDLNLRIGRAAAIWRPYVYFSDLTGTNLLTTELTNRTRRIRTAPGLIGEYQLTRNVRWTQTFGYFRFDHPDPAYVNFNILQTRQEFGYRVLNETSALIWAGYRNTNPSRGSAGDEFFAGLGWRGKPDPRLYTELRIGYGTVQLANPPAGARPMAGVRFNGYTTFQWGPRFALTAIYDRDYVFNELDENDNYVSTLVQLKGEFFLGGNWYVTPYLGLGLDEFQTSGAVTVQARPEIEISYAFAGAAEPTASRVYVKLGYSHSENVVGSGAPIDGVRTSVGFAWKY